MSPSEPEVGAGSPTHPGDARHRRLPLARSIKDIGGADLGRANRRTKAVCAAVLLGAFAIAALTLPVPSPTELRAWADAAGPATALVFLLAYGVLTVAPIPRTVFNLAAGLLLGNTLGVAVALIATSISGYLGFVLARALGREVVTLHLSRTPLRSVDERLADGGLLAVASLRLIPVIPFAPLSYCCGISALRLRPYLAGTALGSLPGTVAVVVLGDALAGTTPPALVAMYAMFALLGCLGLVRALRTAASHATPAFELRSENRGVPGLDGSSDAGSDGEGRLPDRR